MGSMKPGIICMNSILVREAPCAKAMACEELSTSAEVRLRSNSPPVPPAAMIVALAVMDSRRSSVRS